MLVTRRAFFRGLETDLAALGLALIDAVGNSLSLS
jgi:hypothetical protein